MKAVRGNLYCIVNADVKLFPPLSLSLSRPRSDFSRVWILFVESASVRSANV